MTDIDCTGMSFEQATKVAELLAEVERLMAALQEIADMRYDNTSAAAIARRALEPKP
jgi:hypothetical protein